MHKKALIGTHHNCDYASVPIIAFLHIFCAFLTLMTNPIA